MSSPYNIPSLDVPPDIGLELQGKWRSGYASWYGFFHDGFNVASTEVEDNGEITDAHPELPPYNQSIRDALITYSCDINTGAITWVPASVYFTWYGNTPVYSNDPAIITYTGDYSRSDIIAAAEAAAGAYGDWEDGYAVARGAVHYLPDWGYFNGQAQYMTPRIVHQPTYSGYLKVWLQLRAQLPQEGSTVHDVIIPYDAYIWNGKGNPCYDSTKSIDDPLVLITNEFAEITPEDCPDISSSTGDGSWFGSDLVLEIVKWSCLPDYEPDISNPLNPQQNGYPDPTWSPSP